MRRVQQPIPTPIPTPEVVEEQPTEPRRRKDLKGWRGTSHIPNPPPGKVVIYTQIETAEQMTEIETLLLKRFAAWNIVRQMKVKFPGISAIRVNKLIARVRDNWKAQDDESKPHRKAEAMRRVFKQIKDITERLDSTTKPLTQRMRLQMQRTLAYYEGIMADMEGTRAIHVEVDVNATVKNNLIAVMANMTPEMTEEYLREFQETQRLAAIARELPVATIQRKTG